MDELKKVQWVGPEGFNPNFGYLNSESILELPDIQVQDLLGQGLVVEIKFGINKEENLEEN